MAIPNINEKYISEAIEFIDENGIPSQHQSTKYALMTVDGKKYPPKYVIAVADYLANGTEISTEGFNAVEAKNYLQQRGYNIQIHQEKYELIITSDSITSTDERFTMNNLSLGDNYKPIDTFFEKANGDVIRRNRRKSENLISNQTLPRLACQIFEKKLTGLSVEEREAFPVCKYNPNSDMICGIYSSRDEYRSKRSTWSIEYSIYHYGDGRQLVIYSWNLFSTIIFAQECLKRFGEAGDKFKLIYREKEDLEKEPTLPAENKAKIEQEVKGFRNSFSPLLIESKNIILHGAPGTGKSYLAKEIAADIISDGYLDRYDLLSDEQKKQVEFVQFHPSYDYSDFVEGLRPVIKDDGTMGFELQDGIFKSFVERAKRNYEDSKKAKEDIEKVFSVQEQLSDFFSSIEFGVDEFKTISGNKFFITNADEKRISISIPGNETINRLTLNTNEIRKMLESGKDFEKIRDVTAFFGKTFATQAYSYDFAIYKAIKASESNVTKVNIQQEELKKYIFIIDEINRGEISKIFGELFFAIDPGYRGKAGEVSTQYSNMHIDSSEKFYIPENVFIIGTMNDIDRSVDSFDFAMRRRFRFIELKADEHMDMLSQLENEELQEEAVKRMTALNREIANTEDLNDSYQIGASYFLKLSTISFDQLWTDYLQPLLREYVNGMYDEEETMNRFAKAYGFTFEAMENTDEYPQS